MSFLGISPFLIFILGLVFGSFAGVLIYRIPKNKSFVKGRSYCDNCKTTISWYDNIPLISFILLRGKCRHCNNKIPVTYPIIELVTGLMFLLIYTTPQLCNSVLIYETVCSYNQMLGVLFFPITSIFTLILICIFFIDLETFLIPDTLVYVGYSILLFVLIFIKGNVFENLFAGFLASLLLLIIHLVTLGRGMGLGDVKLAVFVGSIFGVLKSLEWLFVGFLTGGFMGIILILVRKVKFKQEIPFGPFLVTAFFVVFFAGDRILALFK